jgi:uncharacterized protein
MILDVSSLPEEETGHEWLIGPEFFMDCPAPVPLKGPVRAEGRVLKSGETIYFSAEASGEFELVCSLCAKSFVAPVEVSVEAVFTPGPAGVEKEKDAGEDAGDTETVYYAGDAVDLFPPLRDQITLAEPMRPLCREDCKGLCLICGADLNKTKCECKVTSGDPRFAGLKNLLTKEEGENAGS